MTIGLPALPTRVPGESGMSRNAPERINGAVAVRMATARRQWAALARLSACARRARRRESFHE